MFLVGESKVQVKIALTIRDSSAVLKKHKKPISCDSGGKL
jgi:hypothetical protein